MREETVQQDTSAGDSSLSGYYNASQLRADTWSRLKNLTSRLDKAQRQQARTATLRVEAEQALAVLEPIEHYWAFPGSNTFQHLKNLLDKEDYTLLARIVARIVRALMSNAYRRKTIPLELHGSGDDDDEYVVESEEDVQHARPYFEVLIVDNITTSQQQMLRRGLRDMRRPEDPFIYESVVVNSL
ncbi:MAG: hypothetical protein AAF495_03750 [Pseudomonadota bacterium]